MFVLGDLPRVAWHGKKEGRSQMIGWDPKNGSGAFFPSAKKGKEKKSVVGQGSWWTEPKAKYSGLKKTKKISDKKKPYLQASTKNKTKSTSP